MDIYFGNEHLKNFFEQVFLWNTLEEYTLALIIFVLLYIGVKIFKKVVLNKLEKASQKSWFEFDENIIEFIKSIPFYFYWTIYIYFPLKYLSLPEPVDLGIDGIFWAVVLLQFVRFALTMIRYFLSSKLLSWTEEENQENKTTFNLLVLIAKIIVWATAVLLFLTNLWFEITPLLASLWVGGVAVAFALQNILEDIFSSISIYLDKPFKIWDFISIGWDFGTVEKIWIKTTRLKTLQWEQLVISNREITNARVNNFGIMDTRRIVFHIWVVYETSLEKLKKIPQIVESIFEDEFVKQNAEFGRAHFQSFGEYSLNYEVVYNVRFADYDVYMDTQEKINLLLIEKFRNEWIEFAYPTQSIKMEKDQNS